MDILKEGTAEIIQRRTTGHSQKKLMLSTRTILATLAFFLVLLAALFLELHLNNRKAVKRAIDLTKR